MDTRIIVPRLHGEKVFLRRNDTDNIYALARGSWKRFNRREK